MSFPIIIGGSFKSDRMTIIQTGRQAELVLRLALQIDRYDALRRFCGDTRILCCKQESITEPVDRMRGVWNDITPYIFHNVRNAFANILLYCQEKLL